jgi:transposase
MLAMLADLDGRIAGLDREIARRAREDEAARLLMTVPGIGPVTATALLAIAPAPEAFNRGRDFAAWLGLVPRQHSSAGKERLGAITRQGERTLRRLLILGASAVVRHAGSRGAPAGSWLAGMLARKPRMLVTVALANKTARIVWAVMRSGESTGLRRWQLSCPGLETSGAWAVEGGYGATVGKTGPGKPGLSTVPRARLG